MTTYYKEEIFFNSYGDMQIGEFVRRCVRSFTESDYQNYDRLNQTVRSFFADDLKGHKGFINYYLIGGRDDPDMIFISRKYEVLKVVTKRDGESRSWVEIGKTQQYQDSYGNLYTRWIKDPLRYPHKDRRLSAVRKFGHEYIYHDISVAFDYPLEIRVISRGPVLKNEKIDTTERTIWTPKNS